MHTRIRFCKLVLQTADEKQSRVLIRQFLIRHFRCAQISYSYLELSSGRAGYIESTHSQCKRPAAPCQPSHDLESDKTVCYSCAESAAIETNH